MELHAFLPDRLRGDMKLNPNWLVSNLLGDEFVIGEAPFPDRQLLPCHHVSGLASLYRHAGLGDHFDHPRPLQSLEGDINPNSNFL